MEQGNYGAEFQRFGYRYYPGTTAEYQFMGPFIAGSTYYFCMWIMDEADNWSYESNIATTQQR